MNTSIFLPKQEPMYINGIKLNILKPPYFIAPDLEKAMDFYFAYIAQSIGNELEVYTPDRYVQAILIQVEETKLKQNAVVASYKDYVGLSKSYRQLRKAQAAYKDGLKLHTYLKTTDRKEQTRLYNLDQLRTVIKQRLQDGETLTLQPVTFKPDSKVPIQES